MKYCFGDIVIVEENMIGVVVRSWCETRNTGPIHEVYVRLHNEIREYPEGCIRRYMVRHKYLTDEELYCQKNAEMGW